MKEIELKPCPFCGSIAIIYPYLNVEEDFNQYSIICQNEEYECNARIDYCDTKEQAKEQAIEQWNRRI